MVSPDLLGDFLRGTEGRNEEGSRDDEGYKLLTPFTIHGPLSERATFIVSGLNEPDFPCRVATQLRVGWWRHMHGRLSAHACGVAH
jgi:hypothetical protein